MAIKDNQKYIRMEVTDGAIKDFKIKEEDIIMLRNGEGYRKYALVPVSDEIYRAYSQPQWRESQKNARDSHCMVKSEKTGKLIRCEGGRKCETCGKRNEHFYRQDFGGSTFSFDMLIEDGLELEDENSFEDTIINRKVIQELIEYAYQVREEYGDILKTMRELGGDPKATEVIKALNVKENHKRRYYNLIKEALELAKDFLS